MIDKMKLSDIEKITKRVSRLEKELSQIDGDGFNYSYCFDDGTTTKYTLHNIKSFDEIEDKISTLFIWIWSLKDYIKNWLRQKNIDSKLVEEYVNNESVLAICADLANLQKHGKLKKSRSSKYPVFGKLEYNIPQDSLDAIIQIKNDFEFIIKNHQLIEFNLPIYDNKGNKIGNAVDIIDKSMNAWNRFIEESI